MDWSFKGLSKMLNYRFIVEKLKLFIILLLYIVCINVKGQYKTDRLFIEFKQNCSLLEVELLIDKNMLVDDELWFFRDQYSNVNYYFLLEIFNDNQKVSPLFVDVTVTPPEYSKPSLDTENSLNNSRKNVKVLSNQLNIYSFTVLNKDNIRNYIDNFIKKSKSAYFYYFRYFNFEEDKTYEMQISLIAPNGTCIIKSNKTRFVWKR
jgi:hypothetical protein